MHEAEQLTAVVQETTFRNEDNGYTVLRVGSGRSQQTVVGVMPELSPGENVTFEGYWTEHPVYGRQFNARACAITPPTGKSAIEKYLGSGLIRGIGPATAKLIVNRFGEKALDILDEQPQRLTELPGIGPKKAAMIAESYLQQMGMRRALVFLQNYGISPTLAMRIAKYYGEDTVELVRENPYRMVMDVEGVGFLTADRMALSMGIDPKSEFRIRAALFYLMGEAASSGGHTYLPREMLLDRACKMLHAEAEPVDRQISQALLQKMLMGFSVPDCEQALCLPLYFHAEQEIALRLAQLMRARPYKRVAGLDKRILQYEGELGVHFSALQKRAITSAVEEGVLVVTGGPGTGKTTIIRCIISLLKAENDILLCAPTGRAAKRMSEATGEEATDHPPSAGIRRRRRHLRQGRGLSAGGGLPDRGRDEHGGRHSHARPSARGDPGYAPDSGGRCGPAAQRGRGQRAQRHPAKRCGAQRAPDRYLPPGREQHDRVERAPDQQRANARSAHAGHGLFL